MLRKTHLVKYQGLVDEAEFDEFETIQEATKGLGKKNVLNLINRGHKIHAMNTKRQEMLKRECKARRIGT